MLDVPSLSRPSPPAARRGPAPATLVFVAGLAALVALFAYDYFFVRVYLVAEWEWDVTRSDWLFGLSAWLLAYLVTVPLVSNPTLAGRYWRRLRARPGALAGLAYLVAFLLAGTVGAALVGRPSLDFAHAYQPPAFTTADASIVGECIGPVTDGQCHGTLAHPLGTDSSGFDVLQLVMLGTHTAVYVAVIAAALIVPIGTVVGAVAGYYGGAFDTALMRYVDVQQTVPAVVVYIVLIVVLGKSLFLLVLVFGLFSWGGIARVVRSEVLQRRSAEYISAAKNLGGSRGYVLRRHLLPNVSHAAVTSVAQTIPLLLITEAAVAYLGLGDADMISWGTVVASGVTDARVGVAQQWWVSTAGALALAGSVLAFKLLGDTLRDVLDPRGD